MISPGTITVGGLTLNQPDVPREADVLWLFDDVDGWHAGAAVEIDSQPRVVAHGPFGQSGRRGGRTITVGGNVVAPDRPQAGDAADRIAACLADGEFGRFDFYDVDQGWRWAMVQLAGTPDVSWTTETHIKFQLQFFAPDAYRYGQTSSATVGFAAASGSGMVFPLFNPAGFLSFGALPSFGTLRVQNPGTAPSSPVFEVTGPTPQGGFTITSVATGKRITFLGVVPDGMTLTLDASDGSVLLQGVADRSGDTLVEGWPVVPPQSVAEFLFEPLGSATSAQFTTRVVATYY